MTTTTYIGVIDGLHTWEVRDESGTVIGMNQSADLTPPVPESVSARVEWDYAPYVERTHPMLVPLAAALGLSEEQVDQAFVEAAVI